MSYKTSTSTGGTIGRAAIGGILGGSTGAIIGANTATRETKSDITSYNINITMRNMRNPIISVKTPSESICNTVASVLKNIIDQNEKTL